MVMEMEVKVKVKARGKRTAHKEMDPMHFALTLALTMGEGGELDARYASPELDGYAVWPVPPSRRAPPLAELQRKARRPVVDISLRLPQAGDAARGGAERKRDGQFSGRGRRCHEKAYPPDRRASLIDRVEI